MIPNQLEVISKGKHWSTTQNPYFSAHTRSVSAHGAVYFFLIYILGILALTNRHYLLLALKSEFSLKVTIKKTFMKDHSWNCIMLPRPPTPSLISSSIHFNYNYYALLHRGDIQNYTACNFPMTVQPMAAVDTEKLHSLPSQRHYQVTVETKLANTP